MYRTLRPVMSAWRAACNGMVLVQVLSKLATPLWEAMVSACLEGCREEFERQGGMLLDLLADLDTLLNTCRWTIGRHSLTWCNGLGSVLHGNLCHVLG
jgi:hypothetical protein